MSRLYLANPTPQNQVVHYRLDYSKEGELNANSKFQPARQQDIAAGRQIQLGGDFHAVQINEIIEQLTVYGLVMVDDVPRLGRRPATYVASVDKPVPIDVLKRVQFHNSTIKSGEGTERRQKASVAVDQIVQNTVAGQLTAQGIDAAPAEETRVSFEQLEQSEAGERLVEEGYLVQPDAKGGGKKPPKKK